MLIYVAKDTPGPQIELIRRKIHHVGFTETHVNPGVTATVINCIGDLSPEIKAALKESFQQLSGVTDVVIVKTPFRLTSRQAHPDDLDVMVGDIAIGRRQPLAVIAGPCAVESEEQILTAAKAVKVAGAKMLRGGAYKPRMSPFTFQGLGEEALPYLARARAETSLPIVTEVVDAGLVETVARYADVLQIGTNNMFNTFLLEAVGSINKPVILKRHHAASVDAWLTAADKIVRKGNNRVILCARGVTGIANGYTRFNSDLDIIPVIRGLTHHPIIYDPSHNAGDRALVPAISLAAVAAGADGLLIEVHPDPRLALCDGKQSMLPADFRALMADIGAVAHAVGRCL